MKNNYEVIDNVVHIAVRCQGNTYTCMIDLDDFDKANEISGTWYGHLARSNNSIYVCHSDKDKKEVKLHRVTTSAPKGKDVDHINHNTLDNRKENLRVCERFENAQNRKPKQTRGVYFHKKTGKYQVTMCIKGKQIYLGLYNTIEEAQSVAISFREENYAFSDN